MDDYKKNGRRSLNQDSFTKKELSRIVYQMQLLDRPMCQWDENAIKGHISRRAKTAALVREQRRAEKYNRLQVQKRLVEQGLLRLEEKEGQIYASLTSCGRVEALKDRIVSTKDDLPDGQVCLVSYDVPEHTRNIRWHIRQILKEAGFKLAHKSVWESAKNVVTDMRSLVKEIKATDWIKVYLASV